MNRILAIALLIAGSRPAAGQTGRYRNLSPPGFKVTTDYEARVPMRDGVHLAANIVRPAVPGRYPVVISYIPYGKDPNPYFAERGYVAVFAEQRGTGTSEGRMNDYFDAQSFRDGYDLVEWAAGQPWSNGKVGLEGISFGAINSTRVAALRPPHLKAIAVNSSYANFYGDHWYPGGVRTNHPYVWHGANNLLATMLRGPIYDDGKGGKVVDLDVWKRHQADNGWRQFFQPQWDHPNYDAYWEEKDLRSKYPDFAVPTLQFANYFDHARNHDEAYQNFLILKAKKVPQKLVAGPWTHGGFGPAHVVDFNQVMLAWFDTFLKGVETGITQEPPVTIFVMRENRWRDEEDWPIARRVPTALYLTGAGGLARLAPTGELLASRRFTYRPWVGSGAGPYGTWFNPAYTDFLVQPDQRVDEAESLTFTGDSLPEDVEVTGMPEINFSATSSATNTDFTIKVSDVLPSGKSEMVTRGWINSSYRESNVNPRMPEDWKVVTPSAIIPGKVYHYRVTLQNISYLFKTGHRIRVTIASSDWPSNWPNPKPAENEVRFDRPDGDLAWLMLPVIPKRSTPLPEPRLPLLPDPPAREVAPGSASRIWIENDLSAKTVTYRSVATAAQPIPGGVLNAANEWKIALTKEPPYQQTIDLVTTWTLVRVGHPDVRFVYQVTTDSSGPKAKVTFREVPKPQP